MYKILIVEDEYHIRNIIHEYFAMKNIEVVEACNGYEALELMNDNIDLILLDIMMPGIDGYEVCKQLRMKSSKPIIFISALQEEQNQLMAYDLGADDYITKPFKPSLLYAKCLAIIKRDKKVEEDIITFGKIKLDKINHLLIIDEKLQVLANKEYELLSYLCQFEGRLLSREQILNHVWGYDYFGDGRAIDTYIKKLRKKLGKYSSYIQTVIKTGYMFKVVNNDEKE
ncbi:MAG: response regulator transcription factor [Coprobacillus sp.]|nr:response regulator transcription factor [Coprobacillus sp.]